MKTELLVVLVITLPPFFLIQALLLMASVDIASAHANDEERGVGGSIWIQPSHLLLLLVLFLLLLTYHLLFPWVQKEWSVQPKHSEKPQAWGLIR